MLPNDPKVGTGSLNSGPAGTGEHPTEHKGNRDGNEEPNGENGEDG
jgi:hypothetical protein